MQVLPMLYLAALVLTATITCSQSQKLPPACQLGPDLLNGLVNAKNKDEEEFGVENTFGLVGDHPGDDMVLYLSPQELQNCIQHYLHAGPPTDQPVVAAMNLHYEQLPAMGEPLAIPIPIPEDEDYLPGSDGYTTYINPYNFKEKLEKLVHTKVGQDKLSKVKKNKQKGTDFEDIVVEELLAMFEPYL